MDIIVVGAGCGAVDVSTSSRAGTVLTWVSNESRDATVVTVPTADGVGVAGAPMMGSQAPVSMD